MDIWKSLSGMVRIRLTSADAYAFVAELLSENIEIMDLHDGNDLTLYTRIYRRDLHKVSRLAENKNIEIEIVGRAGVFWVLRRTVFRPVVVMCLFLVLVTVFYFPGRVFFVYVEGNDSVPTNLILSCAEECGIGFGADRGDVRSERVKNMLLSKVPQLQWVGINTQGCTAVISVREKSEKDMKNEESRVGSIVAVCDGVVEQCTVYKGNPLCKPGTAVKKGQVLVSGFTDCGIMIQATRAEAEVFGTTKRQLQVIASTQIKKRTEYESKTVRYGLIIGKKQINFYKDSGISGAECVKMKEIKYLTLPGGFKLPIALVTESVETYELAASESKDTAWVAAFAETYLRSRMVAGRIIDCSVYETCFQGVFHFTGTYDCYEMIGVPKYEETIE